MTAVEIAEQDPPAEDIEFMETAYAPLLTPLRRCVTAVFVPVGQGRECALAFGDDGTVLTWDGRPLPDHLGDVVIFTVTGPGVLARVRLRYPMMLTACDIIAALAQRG